MLKKLSVRKKSVKSNVLSFNLKFFRTKLDIKSCREIIHLEISLTLMSSLLKHANYPNAVLKSLKIRGLT